MLVVRTDGYCAPNPGGRASWAFVARDGAAPDAPLVRQESGIAAETGGDGALAEWRAAYEALAWLTRHAVAADVRAVEFLNDNNNVVKALARKGGVPRDPERRVLAQECRRFTHALAADGVVVRFRRIPRHENAEADGLASAAWRAAAAARSVDPDVNPD